MIKRLIEQIEGEAILTFETKEERITDVTIDFPHFRGIESILQGRPARDALVISPRVCGICSHSHLMASVRALEDLLHHHGVHIALSDKAKTIREITLYCELIQNHLKWFYLTLAPKLAKLTQTEPPAYLAMHRAVTQITGVIATFAGQWPHTSYAIPGGIASDPTPLEVMQADTLLCSVIDFFEERMIQESLESILALTHDEKLFTLGGDLPDMLRLLEREGLDKLGQSYGRFIVLGSHSLFSPAKLSTEISHSVDFNHVTEKTTPRYGQETFAKNVRFNGEFYETGPLARALVRQEPLIHQMFQSNRDTISTRITARVYEIALLLHACRQRIASLDLNEPSYIEPECSWQTLSGQGVGIVEAPRGSLIHTITLEHGTIQASQIITPTQWNLGNATPQEPGVAQKAMLGLSDTEVAEFVFRTFDICSICTTH
ncbi:MAG: hydrogenase [Hydrogenimonas sp.]|nr:MAG: hydrogenase [Hydrogenimonas sp.]